MSTISNGESFYTFRAYVRLAPYERTMLGVPDSARDHMLSRGREGRTHSRLKRGATSTCSNGQGSSRSSPPCSACQPSLRYRMAVMTRPSISRAESKCMGKQAATHPEGAISEHWTDDSGDFRGRPVRRFQDQATRADSMLRKHRGNGRKAWWWGRRRRRREEDEARRRRRS